MLVAALTLLVLATPSPAGLTQAPPSAPPSPPRASQGATDEPVDLVEPIRAAIRWLRTTQDAETGAYGAGVETTAVALRAFAECPDRYRSVDGPFVRRAAEFLASKQASDGSIHDAGANDEQRIEQTRAAAEALLALGEPAFKPQLGKALAFLGTTDLAPSATVPDGDAEAGERFARELLSKQKERGRWDGPRGRVHETATAVVALSAVERARARPAGGEPAKVEALPAFSAADRAAASKAIERGSDFLSATSPDGRFGAPGKPDAGLTAMALAALQTRAQPRPPEMQKKIDQGLAWLASLQKPDGSIHDGKLANYITSASIGALARSGDPKWKDVIERAREFLVGLQADEGEGYSEGDLYYGGIGYGSTERPDLSNLQMALEALATSGLEPGAPTYRKALKFLERCQNRSESNDLDVVAADGTRIRSGDDGGAAYAPGDSKAGFVEIDGGVKVPRSYGSMTYALLKCMLHAGVAKDDPRLAAAAQWCSENYTLDVNPGFDVGRDPAAPYQGLFYYLHTLAQALALLGNDTLRDSAGVEHAWRQEVCGRVVSMQSKTDGSWTNRNSPRWMEGNPLLGTAYALLTLDAALPR